jgi:hypothetical protein
MVWKAIRDVKHDQPEAVCLSANARNSPSFALIVRATLLHNRNSWEPYR